MTGVSLPPPYVGIPKTTLFVARKWRELGNEVAISFIYKNSPADDLGALARYFFEYEKIPNKIDKLVFLFKYFFVNPFLYFKLFKSYYNLTGVINRELIINCAYGVFVDTIISDFKPQVILSEAALIKSFMVGQVAKLYGIPVVFDTYAEVHYLTWINRELVGEKNKKYWQEFLGLADLIIAPSQYCATGPLKYLNSNKVKVIFHGIDLSMFDGCEQISQKTARQYFNLPEDLFLVLSVGALTERKGHDHLIEAVGKLLAQGKKIGVVLCGPGSQDPWKWLAAKHGLADNIFLFSGLSEEELVKLYRAGDLYCDASNSTRACLGMSLTESMAAQLPVIVYDNGGLPEVVREGFNGLITPINDIVKLAEGILKIIKLSTVERLELGLNGEKLAKEVVDLKVTAVEKLDALKSVIN